MNCIICDIVLPELQDEILRLKAKIKKLKHDSVCKLNSDPVRPQHGDGQAGGVRRGTREPEDVVEDTVY